MGRARRVQLHVRRRHLGMDGRQRERHHAELQGRDADDGTRVYSVIELN